MLGTYKLNMGIILHIVCDDSEHRMYTGLTSTRQQLLVLELNWKAAIITSKFD